MPRYIAESSITHGQGRGSTRMVWGIKKGQTFDPAEMEMADEVVESLLKKGTISVHKDQPAEAAVAVSRPERVPKVASQIARALQEPNAAGTTSTTTTRRTSAAAGAVGGSTQDGKAPTTGGSTQNGQPPK